MISVKQLLYFRAVARTGSILRASAEIHVAQPALSTQITQLEQSLGVKLLVRHSRGVELTQPGITFLRRAEQIIDLITLAESEIRTFPSDLSGEVRVGFSTTTTPVLTLPLLEAFSMRLPNVAIRIVEGMTGHVQEWLEKGDLDVAMLFDSESLARHFPRILARERLALVGPWTQEFRKDQDLKFLEIAKLPIIHTTRAHRVRQLIDAKARSLDLPLNIVAEIDSLTQIRSLVLAGHGYTILPRVAVTTDWVHTNISAWDIDEADLVLDMVLVSSPAFARTHLNEPVLQLLSSVVNGLINSGQWRGASRLRSTGS